MQRDVEVTARLQEQGWTVLRFWGHEIQKELEYCISVILDEFASFSPFSRIEQLTFVLASAAFVAALNLQDSLSMYFLRKLTSTLVKHTNIYMGTIPKTI